MTAAAPIDRTGAVATGGAAEAARTTLAQLRDAAPVPGWPALAVAAGLSVALHLAAMAALAPRPPVVAIEGGAPPALAALGHAFEDFVHGAQPVTPPVAPAAPPAAAPTAAPSLAPSTAAERADPALAAFADPAALALPEAPAARPTEATPPVEAPAMAEPVRPETAVTREEPAVTVSEATPDTPRPRARPDPAARAPAAAPPQPAGTAAQDARRGAETGQEAAPAARTGAAPGAAATAGSAAASNYPGEVLRQLQRTRRARVSGRGLAVVSFSIADSGALASVAIATSSGSAALDQAALDHIRRAAPFPPPPAGAQRQFRFEFASR